MTSLFRFFPALVLLSAVSTRVLVNLNSTSVSQDRFFAILTFPIAAYLLIRSRISIAMFLFLCWIFINLLLIFTDEHPAVTAIAPYSTSAVFLIFGFCLDFRSRSVRITAIAILVFSLFSYALAGLVPDYSNFLLDRGRLSFPSAEANIMGATAIFLLAVCIHSSDRAANRSIFILSLSVIILAQSKAPVLALIAFYIAASEQRAKAMFVLGASIYFVTLMTLVTIVFFGDEVARFYSGFLRENNIAYRMRLLEAALRAISDFPFFGHGPTAFASNFQYFKDISGSERIDSVWIPNILISVIYNTGVIGALLFGTAAVGALTPLLRFAPESNHRMMAASLLSLIIFSMSTTIHTTALFALCFGMSSRVAHDFYYGGRRDGHEGEA